MVTLSPAQLNSWTGDPGQRPHCRGSTSQRDTHQAQTCLTSSCSSQSPHRAIPREQSPEPSHLLLLGWWDRLCWESGQTKTLLGRTQLWPAILRWEGEKSPPAGTRHLPKGLHKGSSVQQLLEKDRGAPARLEKGWEPAVGGQDSSAPRDCPRSLALHLSLGTIAAASAWPAQDRRLLVCRVHSWARD